MPYRVPSMLRLSAAEQAELEGWARRRKTAQALALRARVVLQAAEGRSNTAIAAELGVAKHTVGKWRERFAKDRLEGLRDQPRSGAPRTVTDERVAGLLVRTLEAAPEDATHWSTRAMAAACGLSAATVQRVWRAFGLKPHRTESFKLSSDPEGPRHRRPLSQPARSRAGAVHGREDRDAGGRAHPARAADAPGAAGAAHLGLRPARDLVPLRRAGRGGRPGDRPLLPPAPRGGIPRVPGGGRCRDAGRGRGARGPGQRLDPQGAHDPRLAPPAATLPPALHADRECSWLNQAERFFALLTARRLKRGVHRSVDDLEAAVLAYIDRHNAEPAPFRWTKSADEILARVARSCTRIIATHEASLLRTSEARY
jgi:transposase